MTVLKAKQPQHKTKTNKRFTKKWIDRCFIWYLVAKRGTVESISYIWPTMTTAGGGGAAAVDSRGA